MANLYVFTAANELFDVTGLIVYMCSLLGKYCSVTDATEFKLQADIV